MIFVFYGLLVFLGFLSLALIWATACNDKAFRQQMELIPQVGDPDFREKIDMLNSVSYDDVFWFDNPKNLYENKISD